MLPTGTMNRRPLRCSLPSLLMVSLRWCERNSWATWDSQTCPTKYTGKVSGRVSNSPPWSSVRSVHHVPCDRRNNSYGHLPQVNQVWGNRRSSTLCSIPRCILVRRLFHPTQKDLKRSQFKALALVGPSSITLSRLYELNAGPRHRGERRSPSPDCGRHAWFR